MRYVTADHYFTPDPSTAPQIRYIEFEAADREFRLAAASGVFSAGRLDPGTAVLLAKANLPGADERGPLLDLGCGYGPIATVLATVAQAAMVYAVDVNQRALDLVRRNATEAGVADRVIATSPDEVPEGVTFSQIWSNPPIRIGKQELHGLLRRWLARLAPDGEAWFVVARNLGADSLQRWLVEDEGWLVDRYASQKGFRVLHVHRKPDDGTSHH